MGAFKRRAAKKLCLLSSGSQYAYCAMAFGQALKSLTPCAFWRLGRKPENRRPRDKSAHTLASEETNTIGKLPDLPPGFKIERVCGLWRTAGPNDRFTYFGQRPDATRSAWAQAQDFGL